MTCLLLDTNVLSGTLKPRPNVGLSDFLSQQDPSNVFVSVLTLGELRRGAANKRSKDTTSANRIDSWIDGIEADFADRVLAVDVAVARVWGEISVGRTRPVADTLIAATALVHGLTLVTRNMKDFDGIKVALINPFAEAARF